jgi:hypothetical protein
VQTTDASGTALSSDALDAIASADSVWAERVTVAWPGGLHPDVSSMIVSAETNASLVGGLPDQTRRPVGFQSRTLKLVLGGMVDGTDEAFDAYALFNPLNKDSDFYRKDLRGTKLTYDVGPYVRGSAEPVWIRQFTGEIDDITPGSDGAVIFDCLDRMNELRSVVAMPAVVTAPPYNAGLTPEFGHDALLRNATNGVVSESPPVRPHCILSIGFRSSIQPEVGTLDVTFPQLPPTFAPGAWGTAYAGNQPATDPSGSYWVGPAYGLDTSTWPLTTKLAFEATVTGVGAAGLNASFRYGVPFMLTHLAGQPFLYSVHGLTVDIDDTGINVTTTAGSDFWTITLDSSPHTLLFWASVSGGTITCHAKVDGGTVHNFAGVTFTDDMTTWTNAMLFTAGAATVEAWQTTTETAPATSYPFTPQAVLAPSTLALTVTPAVSGDPLEAFKDISTAELATAGFDEKGIYRTATRASRRGGIAVGTYSSDSTLDDVEIQLTGAGYANRVQAPVTTWKFAAPATVWSSETARVIPGHTAGHSFIVDTGDQLVAAVDGTISLLPDGGGNDGHSYFRASVDPAGLNRHTGLTNGRIAQIDSTHFRVTFDNTWQRKAYLMRRRSAIATSSRARRPCRSAASRTARQTRSSPTRSGHRQPKAAPRRPRSAARCPTSSPTTDGGRTSTRARPSPTTRCANCAARARPQQRHDVAPGSDPATRRPDPPSGAAPVPRRRRDRLRDPQQRPSRANARRSHGRRSRHVRPRRSGALRTRRQHLCVRGLDELAKPVHIGNVRRRRADRQHQAVHAGAVLAQRPQRVHWRRHRLGHHRRHPAQQLDDRHLPHAEVRPRDRGVPDDHPRHDNHRPPDGNITNSTVATVPSAFWPGTANGPLASGNGGPLVSGAVDPAGVVSLYATVPGASLASGVTITLAGAFLD